MVGAPHETGHAHTQISLAAAGLSLPPPTLASGTLSPTPPCTETGTHCAGGMDRHVERSPQSRRESACLAADFAAGRGELAQTPWKPSLPRENQRVNARKRKRL